MSDSLSSGRVQPRVLPLIAHLLGLGLIGAMRVFDSNILIYHLNDALPPSVLIQVEFWIAEGAVISVMSRIEVLGYPQSTDQLQQAMQLLAYFKEIPLHESVVQRTITLRQQYRIRLPDAFIAATALDGGLPLVTRNTQDFHIINGLILLNPFA